MPLTGRHSMPSTASMPLPAVPPDHPMVSDIMLGHSHEAIRVRLFVSAILCHPLVRDIASCWDRYLGRHEEVLRDRLLRVNVPDPSEELVRFVLACLSSYNARFNKRDEISSYTEIAVFEAYAAKATELRYQCCAYQFRAADLSSRRLSLCDDFGLRLASSWQCRREVDDLKPLSTPGTKDKHYLKLELDHVVPQAALGWSTSDNIRILCRFCNSGKDCFSSALEPLSVIAANALAVSYGDIPKVGRTITTTVAALRWYGPNCSKCGAQGEKEVTVEFDATKGDALWFVPWRLRVVCYDCWNPPSEPPVVGSVLRQQ